MPAILPDMPVNAGDRQARWRERRRFLAATAAITLLYLGVQAVWMWGAGQLAVRGWTLNDPARTYAAQAADVAARSRQAEAALAPTVPRQIFQLGFEYGYLSQWLGGYGDQPDQIMELLSRPVAAHIQRMNQLAGELGVAPVTRLSVRTAADFSQLNQRIEDDGAGVAARVERASSLRLRHLFLLAALVGTQAAALESRGDVVPIPPPN